MSSSTSSSSPNATKSSGSGDIRTKGTHSSGPKVKQPRVSKSIRYGESFQAECLQLLREIKKGQEEFKGFIINMEADMRAIGTDMRAIGTDIRAIEDEIRNLSRDIRMLTVVAVTGFVVNSFMMRSH